MSLDVIVEHRGISKATLEQCGVWWEEGDDYAVRFPYYHMSGMWYERKGLDPRLREGHRGPKILSPAGGVHHLYNPLKLGPNASLVVYAEGEYDTLSVIDAGFPAIGNQGAESFNLSWARLYTGAVNVLAYDGDHAGDESSKILQRFMQKLGVQPLILKLEEGEDLNDLHKKGMLYMAISDLLSDHGLDPLEYELDRP